MKANTFPKESEQLVLEAEQDLEIERVKIIKKRRTMSKYPFITALTIGVSSFIAGSSLWAYSGNKSQNLNNLPAVSEYAHLEKNLGEMQNPKSILENIIEEKKTSNIKYKTNELENQKRTTAYGAIENRTKSFVPYIMGAYYLTSTSIPLGFLNLFYQFSKKEEELYNLEKKKLDELIENLSRVGLELENALKQRNNKMEFQKFWENRMNN